MIAEPFCSMCGKATVLIHGRGYVCETPSCPCDKEPAIAPQEATMTAEEMWLRKNGLLDLYHSPNSVSGMPTHDVIATYAAHIREADQRTIAKQSQELQLCAITAYDLKQRAEAAEQEVARLKGDKEALQTALKLNGEECQHWASEVARLKEFQSVTLLAMKQLEQSEHGFKSERDALRAALDLARPQLEYIQITGCPCGAREESTHTHPHVGGCGIDALTKLARAALAGEPEAKLKQLRNGEMVEAKDLEGSDGS